MASPQVAGPNQHVPILWKQRTCNQPGDRAPASSWTWRSTSGMNTKGHQEQPQVNEEGPWRNMERDLHSSSPHPCHCHRASLPSAIELRSMHITWTACDQTITANNEGKGNSASKAFKSGELNSNAQTQSRQRRIPSAPPSRKHAPASIHRSRIWRKVCVDFCLAFVLLAMTTSLCSISRFSSPSLLMRQPISVVAIPFFDKCRNFPFSQVGTAYPPELAWLFARPACLPCQLCGLVWIHVSRCALLCLRLSRFWAHASRLARSGSRFCTCFGVRGHGLDGVTRSRSAVRPHVLEWRTVCAFGVVHYLR